MYNEEWGGLPDKEFLSSVDPELGKLRERLYEKAVPSDRLAGHLSQEWAEKLGLQPGIAVAVGAFDAHMGAVGAGIKEGTLVKILGTSTCDIMVSPKQKSLADIPGVCGIVDGSVLPDYYGIEAGQSAVGDIFLWFVNHLAPDKYGKNPDEKFKGLEVEAAKQKPGEHGLLALDWWNGNRSILVDVDLTGMLLGATLLTKPEDIYRALIEATAYGARVIVEAFDKSGVVVNEIVACGGLPGRNKLLMQIYADVTGREIRVAGTEQSGAFGSAMFAAVAAGDAAGGYDTIFEAARHMAHLQDVIYKPMPAHKALYDQIYAEYVTLHDTFGRGANGVMKRLKALRQQVLANG